MMKFSNIKAIALKNLTQMKRDPRMIGLAIFAPIIVTALFGFTFGGDLTHLKVLYLNNDENFDVVFADEISNNIGEDSNINYTIITSDQLTAISAVENNITQAAIIFLSNFTNDLLLGRGSEIGIYINNMNPNVSTYVLTVFQNSIDTIMNSYFGASQVNITITSIYQGPLTMLPSIINVSLCNLDTGWSYNRLSEDLIHILDENKVIDLYECKTLEDGESSVKNGKSRGFIIFPSNFTYDALIKKYLHLELKLDGAEPQAAMAIKAVLSSSLSRLFINKFGESVFYIDEYYYNNPDGTDKVIDSISYFMPAILSFVIFFFSFLLTMLSFIREKKQGTMERILNSPVNRAEIILGYILSFSILGVIEASVILITAIFIFNAQIYITLPILLQTYLIVYIVVLTALGTGIFLSTLAKTEFHILQFIPLVIIPIMLLSGVWAPIETLPEWLRPISVVIPLTYANNALRSMLLHGESLINILSDFGILTAIACLMIFLGIITFKRKLT